MVSASGLRNGVAALRSRRRFRSLWIRKLGEFRRRVRLYLGVGLSLGLAAVSLRRMVLHWQLRMGMDTRPLWLRRIWSRLRLVRRALGKSFLSAHQYLSRTERLSASGPASDD